MSLTLSVKLSVWQQLPLALCGPAHYCEEVSRPALRRSDILYVNAPALAQHHPLTRTFFEDERVRSEALAFIEGGSLADQHTLYYHVAKWAFIPIAERLVEGLHVVLHMFVLGRSRHGVCHAALSLHLPDIAQAVASPDELASLRVASTGCVRRPMLLPSLACGATPLSHRS